MARLFPAWEIVIGNYRIPAAFWATAAFLPLIFVVAGVYPAMERKMTGTTRCTTCCSARATCRCARRWASWRSRSTSCCWCLGERLVRVLLQRLAQRDHLDGPHRAAVLPPLAYWVSYRVCLGLQRSDRAVLEHGIETGIIKRLPHGEFIEVHQPLAGVDDHGHPIPLSTRAPRYRGR